MSNRKIGAIITAVIASGLAATAATTSANADDTQANHQSTNTVINSGNSNSSVTNLRINNHALTIRSADGVMRVWIDNEEVFGQQAEDAIHASRTGQPWWH